MCFSWLKFTLPYFQDLKIVTLLSCKGKLFGAISDNGAFGTKKNDPGSEKHGCNVMILPWSWRNMVMIMPWRRHGGHVFWHGHHDSWHNHGMSTMFSMIHTVIMVLSSCLPSCFFLQKKDCLWMFSQIVAAIYYYTAYLTGFRKVTPPN